MEVCVMNRTDAIRYSYHPQDEQAVVISISTPFDRHSEKIYPSPYNKIVAVLPLLFDDVDGGKDCMTAEDAQKIAAFVKRHEGKKIIVHCDAGVSRSAGIAAAILKHYTGDDRKIFDSPRYCPNMLCYRLTLNALEQ